MPKISELAESNYLKKEDCGLDGIIVTIDKVSRKNLAKEGEQAEYKYLLHFQEDLKPLVLNATNGELIAAIAKDDEMDNWTGTEICLYSDPSIMFGGKRVGGIRVKDPNPPVQEPPKRAGRPAPKPPQAEETDQEIPF